MRVLVYNELIPEQIPNFDKVVHALGERDFARADVRKLTDTLYRARLNKSDRLLFSLYRARGETCCLILEHIRNHAYEKSRFLSRGAEIDEDKIPVIEADAATPAGDLPLLDPDKPRFNILDKILTFDDEQEAIHGLSPPVIIIGSAGSGKTALTLEKMKQMVGDMLYVSLSPYLVRNARDLYYARNYTNDDQEIDFLSFQEFLESIRVPEGREVTPRDFQAWFVRQPAARRLRDAHKVFEEIRGVITGPVGDEGWLSREDYLDLGVKQSIFSEEDRPAVYDLFEKYRVFLRDSNLYDSNIVSHEYVGAVVPRYDFLVVDEVQDITNIQLYLILKSLRTAGEFILTGDSNQIVHPNFFSWAHIKSLFFEARGLSGAHDGEIVRILRTNYRNTATVTEVANRILKLKHARFGSVDRESNYLVRSVAREPGRLQLLPQTPEVLGDLDDRTRRSTRVAVLVLHPDQKDEARRWFNTPLVFSVQEAKGLEYDSIILFNVVSDEAKAFREVTRDVDPAALETDTLTYARARDKRDKSLEVYKFYINALFVAITRAVRNLYWVESDHGHPLIDVLQMARFSEVTVSAEREDSSLEQWQREASRLEMQGKTEQAQDIRDRVLQQKPVPWSVVDRATFDAQSEAAFASGARKQLLPVFEHALLHWYRPILNRLTLDGFKPALDPEDKAVTLMHRKHFEAYAFKNPGTVLRDVERYGIDHRTPFNLTPVMVAARVGNIPVAKTLIERGADPTLTANHGFTAVDFALERGLTDERFARQKLPELFDLLAPPSIDVQARGRLIKLDRHLMEYVLLRIMGALFYRRLGPWIATRYGHNEGFTAKALAEVVTILPEEVLPDRRKKRTYISSILSKNEVDGTSPYNRFLFRRFRHGHYIVDPDLKIRVGTAWVPYYQVFRPEAWGPDHPPDYYARSGLYSEADIKAMQTREIDRGMQKLAAFRADVLGLETDGNSLGPRSP
ncbi:hypothetical protein [Roseospira goensis]|uniref:UvrD-like helicase ATP-binding domain-containing protein n=1 Tax=Roseospira goensis TaxID=391922 RepID=A0A7W6WJR5_9PROT|nr:hypothetical protein [Roseospira goensis]MBB4284939.1 hypothetical protein [Roseospira goensis]